MFFMRGHLHPVPDTPFNLNALAQTNRQSDVSFYLTGIINYKLLLKLEIKLQVLNVFIRKFKL